MEFTSNFKKQIQDFLENKSKTDELFKPVYEKKNKNIDDCIKYIVKEAKKAAKGSSSIGMTSEEVFGMAIHYYDEDSISIGEDSKENVVVKQSPKVDSRIIEDNDGESIFD